MRKLGRVAVVLTCSLLFALPSYAADLNFAQVALRPGVTVDITVTSFKKPGSSFCVGSTVFAVPGLAHTAATFGPFVSELFSRQSLHVCRVLVIDLPGHGKSGQPTGITFGELFVDDYVTAVLGTLDRLKSQGIHSQVIVGHSMGGLIVQMSQARLISQSTSLAKRYGQFLALLLAPVPPVETTWSFAESGQAAAVLAPFITVDPVEGTIVRIPAATWPFLFFTTHAGVLVPGAPTGAQAQALGYLADEPLFAGLQLIGAPPFTRPSVPANTFALNHGTALIHAGFGEDVFFTLDEERQLYQHLTGDVHLLGFAAIETADAVHDMYLSNPDGTLDQLAAELSCHM